MASLTLEHLDKTYPNGFRAVRDVSLRVEDGELMVLVGPSGCGKSTLLRLLAGLEEASGGGLTIGGRPAAGLSPRERNIAMVFQDYALYPTLTVRANLEFPLKMRKQSAAEIRRRVAWAAELLHLGEVLDRLPRQLSGGQRQRVAMGRALVREPAVFLLDEPLSNLDAKLRTAMRGEIADLQRQTGTTMVYVTHDQVEAMTLGQRIAVLRRGRIRQVADPRTLYERPADPFVAGFIGSPPMNLFRAEPLAHPEGGAALVFHGALIARLAADRDPGPASPVIAGIRPEALSLAEPAEPGFPARVAHAEYLGHETLLQFHPETPEPLPAGTPPWTARLPGQWLPAHGSVVRLRVAADAIHLFAEEAEELD